MSAQSPAVDRSAAKARFGAFVGLLALIAFFLTAEGPLARAQQPVKTLSNADAVICVAFSPDGKALAAGCVDSTVRLWDATAGIETASLKGHSNRVRSVAFSPDGKTLVSGSDDKTVRLWNLATGMEKARVEASGGVQAVAFSPDEMTFAFGGVDHPTIWDVAAGKERITLKEGLGITLSMAFSTDGKTLAAGSSDGKVRLWDVTEGKLRATFEGHADWVRSVAISADGKTLVSGSKDKTVRLWNLATGKEEVRVEASGDVVAVAISADGKTAAFGVFDHSTLLDVVAGKERTSLKGHPGIISSLAFSPDGKVLASSNWRGAVALWDIDGQALGARRWANTDDRPGGPPEDDFLTAHLKSITMPEMNTQNICVLAACLLAVVIVLATRIYMGGDPGRFRSSSWMRFYKLWHFPVFILANCLKGSFLGLTIGVLVAVAVMVALAVVGGIVGAFAGPLWLLIGAVIGLALGLLAFQAILAGVLNQGYLKDLSADMFSPEARLRTVHVTPFLALCLLQSVSLLGVIGSMIGEFLTEQEVGQVQLAIVLGFLGFFCAQALACVKTGVKDKATGLALALLQVVVVAFSLLPARRLLAESEFARAALDQWGQLAGGKMDLENVVTGLVGLLVAVFSDFIVGGQARMPGTS